MLFPDHLKYTKEHEWIKVLEGGIALVGITDFAQDSLGDIVYFEIEALHKTVAKDKQFGVVEAVKTASDLFMPVSGEVIEFNPALDPKKGDSPALVNSDPYGEGWIIKIRLTDPTELNHLMDAHAYKLLVEAA